jgi:drug/metabolite transporter (DMT)-like permease
VPAAALLFALGGAFVHAGWNTLLARAPDTRAATGVALVAGTLVFTPVALLTWQVQGGVAPYVAASTIFELGYFVLLATAYQRAEMSLVYPLARGLGPCFVLLVSVLILGARISPLGGLGVLLVAVGIVLVRGARRPGGWRDVALTVAIAACTAGYTLIDKAGLRFADPIPYLWLVLSFTSVGYLAALLYSGGRTSLHRELRPSRFLAGVGMFGAYALVLAALQIAPAASVAAVRETSVVIATLLGAAVLHEHVSSKRLAGAGLVALGVAALAFG